MTYKADPIHEAADKAAEFTGIPSLARRADANQRAYRAKRQIVLPGIAIAGSVACFVATLTGFGVVGALGGLFFLIASAAQWFGPIRLRNANLPYDEWEQMLIWRSRSIGLGAALALAIGGCSVLSIWSALADIGTDASVILPAKSAMAAMWLLITTAIGVTTISASLMLPKPLVDGDDD
jgi:hypothetical protein